ncbi:MAG: TonB-dependent receptor [Pseudomonadota bacterium]
MSFPFFPRRLAPSVLLLAGSVSLATPVLAQDAEEGPITAGSADVVAIDPLVVTATGFPVPEDELGNSVTVITRQEIEEQHLRTLPDALRRVPGMSVVQSGGQGAQTSVFTRGGNSNQTLILLNGRPIGDPSTPNGQIDLAGIPLANVERVEVVRGPGASLYGSQAQAGVINIITRQGEGPFTATGQAEFGTQNTFNQTANVNGTSGPVGYDVTFNALRTRGFNTTPARLESAGVAAEDDGFREYNGAVALNGDISDQLSARAYFGISDARFDLDTVPDDPNAEQRTRDIFVDAALEGSFMNGFWQPTLAFGFADFHRSTTDDADANSATIVDTTQDGSRIDIELRNDFLINDTNLVTLGGGIQRESFKQSGFSNFSGFIIDNDSDADRLQGNVFGQHRFSFDDRFFLTSNIRGSFIEDTGNAVTFSVTPLVTFPETGTTFHGSVGTGFRAPSLFELFGFSPTNFNTAFRGNPDLDPERNFSWEIGARQDLFNQRLGFGATYFNNSFKDAIVTVFDASFNSTTENADTLDTQGVEAFVEVNPFDSLYFRFDYTFTHSDLDDDNPTTPTQALRRPKHQINAVAAYDVTDWFQLTGNLLTVGGRQDIGLFGGFENPKPYTIINLAANFTLLENLEFYVQGNNVTNQEYEPAVGFAGPGAQAIFGIRARF